MSQTKENYETVYIVLQPIEFKEALGVKKLLREIRDNTQLHRYLFMQHWAIQVGEKFYHLQKNEDDTLAVSLVPFKKMETTIKVPIWRTNLTHETRVGMAMGVIKKMGNWKRDEDVRVYEESEDTPLCESERKERGYSSATFRGLIMPMIGKGKYNPVTNNCIYFAMRFLLGQLLNLRYNIHRGTLKGTMTWVIEKWHENGVRHSYKEIFEKLMTLLVITPGQVIRSGSVVRNVLRDNKRRAGKIVGNSPNKMMKKSYQVDLNPLTLILHFYQSGLENGMTKLPPIQRTLRIIHDVELEGEELDDEGHQPQQDIEN